VRLVVVTVDQLEGVGGCLEAEHQLVAFDASTDHGLGNTLLEFYLKTLNIPA
jgi:hypothetical protein